MDILKTLKALHKTALLYAERLLWGYCTSIEAKRALMIELCMDLKSIVVNGYTHLYLYQYAQAIENLSTASSKKQVEDVCLYLIEWTEELINGLEDLLWK